jgi:ankyrin repeat protein
MKTLELMHRIQEINRLLASSVQNEPKSAVSKRAPKRRAAKAVIQREENQKGRKSIDDNNRNELCRAEGQKKLAALRAEILKEKRAPGVEYLEKIFNSSADTSSEDNMLLANLPKECNPPLFLKLLPLCRLAFLYENNGVAEDHAKRLATIFDNIEEVFQYLIHFGKLTPVEYLLHDACLFELPEPENCHFHYWKKKALQKDANGISLVNPRFRKLLSYAPEIEKLLSKQSKQETVQQSRIEAIKKKIRAINKEYKKTEQTPINNPTEEQKNQRREKLSQLSTERSQLLLNLAESCLGLSLEETDILIWEAFYEQYKSQMGDVHKILVKYGISQRNQDLFLKLKPNNDDIKIPNILIHGADIGHAGLYLKKLDIMTPEGKAIAACLGKITGCCQFLGGQGHDCVVHGIESSDDGFYVVCRGDSDNPQLNDAIVAQAWVWRGRNGILVFDSVEAIRSLPEKEEKKIIDIFRYCALKLCSNPEFEHYAVHQINTGFRSGITRAVADTTYYTEVESHSDYSGYSDAKNQLLLGSRDLPYLFYSTPDSSAFKDKIDILTHSFLKESFSSNIPFKDNINIQKAIQFLISSNSGSFFNILRTYAGERHQELLTLIQINRQYIQSLNIGIVNFDVLEQGAYIDAVDRTGKNGLFVAIEHDNLDTAKKIIALNINIKATDQNGNNALSFTFDLFSKNWNRQRFFIKDCIFTLSEKFNLNTQDHNRYAPLGIAILQNDVEIVRLLLQQGAHVDNVQGPFDKTPIQLAIEKGFIDIAHLLLHQGAKLNSIDSQGKNLLMSAITSDNESLDKIVLILLKNGIDIFQEDHSHKTALDYCFKNNKTKYILLIIDFCKESKDIFELISRKTGYGNTLFHGLIDDAAENRENTYIIELVLRKLSSAELKQVLC